MEILLIILLSILLWVVSLQWLSKWRNFWVYFVINFHLVIFYVIWLVHAEFKFLGTDPYGLGQISLIISVLFGHIVIGFIFAFLKRNLLLKQAA